MRRAIGAIGLALTEGFEECHADAALLERMHEAEGD
jgi:hypothetical protein